MTTTSGNTIPQLETLEVPISLLPLILYRFSRALCCKDTSELTAYCIQNVFILLDPVLFAASIYMTLGRLIRNFNAEKYSLIRINWLSGTFMASNVSSFLVPGTGAESLAGTAMGITIAGLVNQVVLFGIFILVSVIFEKRMTR
ncbi:hypothetical protein N7508_010556 [Penicillium antarcticum]|uniref:uncharacterized protein n=1 Tax=Penicillium antarcticum TaxID=416450 RepID=UPI00239A48D5|nr:uncharacterized protein N7508_010556 [Penicillium antarcticum]KAJ5295735.1 hypothetical protein N7508_010556 [Penicillium antarcticum]